MRTSHFSLERSFFIVLFLGVAFLVAYTFRFYVAPLLFGIAFSVVFYPFYFFLLRMVGGIRGLAACATILIVLLVGFTPLSFVGGRIVQDAHEAYVRIAAHNEAIGIFGVIVEFLNARIPYVSVADIENYARSFLEWVIGNLSGIFSSAARFVGNLLLGLLAAYYFFKDGTRMKHWLLALSPFEQQENEAIAESLRLTVNSVIRGTLVVAVVQGILAGIGFAIFGIPQPALWGLVTVLAALVPLFGTSLVMIPAVAYLLFFGTSAAAFGMFIWGFVLVGLVDNMLRPQLIERGIKVHPFLILLSVLGGIASFGPAGFLLGPLALSLFVVLARMYPRLVLEK